jgi:putative transposase
MRTSSGINTPDLATRGIWMWHLDAVFLAVQGERHDLRRAVDQGGHGPDMLVQPRRGKAAAKQCLRKRLKGVTYAPRVLVTDNPEER